jgi:hypothetical protein
MHKAEQRTSCVSKKWFTRLTGDRTAVRKHLPLGKRSLFPADSVVFQNREEQELHAEIPSQQPAPIAWRRKFGPNLNGYPRLAFAEDDSCRVCQEGISETVISGYSMLPTSYAF